MTSAKWTDVQAKKKTGVSRCTAASRKRERKIRGQGKTRAKAAGRARAKRQRAVLAAFVKLETRSHRKNQTTPKKMPMTFDMVSGAWDLGSGIRYQVSGIWYPVSGIWDMG